MRLAKRPFFFETATTWMRWLAPREIRQRTGVHRLERVPPAESTCKLSDYRSGASGCQSNCCKSFALHKNLEVPYILWSVKFAMYITVILPIHFLAKSNFIGYKPSILRATGGDAPSELFAKLALKWCGTNLN